jgi:hypothetical protein
MAPTISEHEYEGKAVILIESVEVDGDTVPVMVEKSIAPPMDDLEAFLTWAQTEAATAIRNKDDRIAKRYSVWPDESWHDVYRVWHQDGSVTVWSTPAPRFPGAPPVES